MRWTRALAPFMIAILVTACGGSSGATDDNGGNGPASEAAGTPEPDPTEGNGGNGGNGGGGDLEQLARDLTPPSSSETSRTTVEGVIFLSFDSSDSPDSLEGFYENAIGGAGLDIISRTSAEGSYSWIFTDSDDENFGGVVSVGPGADGSGSIVIVQVGSGS